MELILLAFVVLCVFGIIMILKSWFVPPRSSNRYAVPGDRSIAIDRRRTRRQKRMGEAVLLFMIFMALVGALIYYLNLA
jgi:ABC-type Fe3+ transport system permease subunit